MIIKYHTECPRTVLRETAPLLSSHHNGLLFLNPNTILSVRSIVRFVWNRIGTFRNNSGPMRMVSIDFAIVDSAQENKKLPRQTKDNELNSITTKSFHDKKIFECYPRSSYSLLSKFHYRFDGLVVLEGVRNVILFKNQRKGCIVATDSLNWCLQM